MTAAIVLPPLDPATRLTVVIPARDEERALPIALAALAAQTDARGVDLAPKTFDIVVLANGCRDATADVARAFARLHATPRVTVVEVEFAPGDAHIGTARRVVMDAVAARYLRAGKHRGIVASTDADTCVDARWVAETLAEMACADAVTGRITIAAIELARLDRVARALYLRDAAHRRIVGELEGLHDPVAHDPLPRHGQHYGASFAVTAEAYVRAGGIPRVRVLEDLAFYEALERIDARVRHSMRVRVATSARTSARVDGGFGTFLGDLRARRTLCVEAPARTVVRLDARAALRRLWHGDAGAEDRRAALAAYGASADDFRTRFDRGIAFGRNVRRFEALAQSRWAIYAPVPVEVALPLVRALRAAANAA
ncbi:MAG: glycosyltransferase [Vulcanimicrobiaceae bacterium]